MTMSYRGLDSFWYAIPDATWRSTRRASGRQLHTSLLRRGIWLRMLLFCTYPPVCAWPLWPMPGSRMILDSGLLPLTGPPRGGNRGTIQDVAAHLIAAHASPLHMPDRLNAAHVSQRSACIDGMRACSNPRPAARRPPATCSPPQACRGMTARASSAIPATAARSRPSRRPQPEVVSLQRTALVASTSRQASKRSALPSITHPLQRPQ